MGGWRRSTDRASLRPNSLLTGNFTGKFAVLGLFAPNWCRETTVPQAFLAQFPIQTIRENILKIREFRTSNREFFPKV
jgi:hypothetical protein